MKLKIVTCILALLLAATAWSSDSDSLSVDPQADRLLRQMCELLKGSPQVSFRLDITEDDLTVDGQAIQISRTLDAALRRPDRLLAEMYGDDGHKGFRYDGTRASLYHADYELYSVAPVPGTLDAALDTLAELYGFWFAMEDFLAGDPYASLMDKVQVGTYQGLSDVRGVSCHHLCFSEEGVDWQIWIEDSPRRRPQKFVMTYRTEEGWPQYTAYFSQWNYAAHLPDALFAFDPPPDARQIKFRSLKDAQQ